MAIKMAGSIGPVKVRKGPSKATVPSIRGGGKGIAAKAPMAPMGPSPGMPSQSPFGMKKGGMVKKAKKAKSKKK